jgi:hypothetical protein
MMSRLPPAAVCAHGKAAAEDLAERRDVRAHARELLHPPEGHAEAGDDLVEHEEDAVRGAELAQSFEETGGRRHDGFDDHARDAVRVLLDQALDRSEVVVAREQGLGDVAFGDSGRAGDREGRGARAGLHEQTIRVAVVPALELHDLAPPGEAAREPYRAHGRLGAGAY